MPFDIDDPFQPLETTRLRLRCVTIEDAAAMSELMTPAVSRWLAAWPTPLTVEMAAARIESSRRMARAGDALPFAVTDKTTGELFGWASIHRDQEASTSGSFGYWLAEHRHGKGYMRELAPRAIAAGFELLKLETIRAGAQIENAASFAVMRACGMKPAGEAMVHAPARARDEPCRFYEIRRVERD